MNNCYLTYETSDEIRKIISSVSRTEDVKLSPNNKKLIILDYIQNMLICLSIKIDNANSGIKIVVDDYLIISSNAFKEPHGVSFLDEEHVTIANRAGDVSIFELPALGKVKKHHLDPICNIPNSDETKVKTPGSIASYKEVNNSHHILVCNNFSNTITSHHYCLSDKTFVENNGIIISKHLGTPDGISISPNKCWIAISNHDTGEIFLYRNILNNNRKVKLKLKAKLGGIVCPHGVRFSPDGNYILVADAGSPYLHIFSSKDGGWEKLNEPTKSIRIISQDKFIEGRENPMEGGIKGIDVSNDFSVLVTTNAKQILSFFDLDRIMLKQGDSVCAEIRGYRVDKHAHQKIHKPESQFVVKFREVRQSFKQAIIGIFK
jgi:hypothetical protein